jgi:flagellar biosynthesis protein FlhF
MNVKRFTARTAREALALVRQALGDDAVVLSTRPSPDGVEVLALAPEGMARIAQAAAQAPVQRAPEFARPATLIPAATRPRAATLAERIAARGEKLAPRAETRVEPSLDGGSRFGRDAAADLGAPSRFDATRSQALPAIGSDGDVGRDVETLGMSTLTFQDYVRERMLKRRQAELSQQANPLPAAPLTPAQEAARPQGAAPLRVVASDRRRAESSVDADPERPAQRHQALRDRINPPRRDPPVLRDEIRLPSPGRHDLLDDGPVASVLSANPRERSELLGELRSMRELIDERFGMLAFMERLQRDPRQATLSQKLFDVGLSPALVRKLVQSLPNDAPDELAWAAGVLERNVLTDEHELPIEDHEGVFALIGATGVGKTTSTAKLAAAFATRHGASQLGLITLDAYRVAAHEQLRTYGRILGVPVHTAHDRASLEDLLELLAGKKLVLIDTAGMAQRDARTRELLEMLQHPAIKKLLVVNAAAQGETVEDVMVAYGVQQCFGVIVSKLDEAVKLGPALDALIRHRAKVVGVANGQRVPEDWHRLSAQALVQRALRGGGGASWRLDASEVNLMFAATLGAGYPGPQGGLSAGGAALHA